MTLWQKIKAVLLHKFDNGRKEEIDPLRVLFWVLISFAWFCYVGMKMILKYLGY